MRRSFLLAGLADAGLIASVVNTGAQQRMARIGVLECRGGASVGFIVGSVTNLGCVLRAAGQPDDFYVATIRKVGLDLGITQESALAWGVFSPAIMPARRAARRSASVSAATCSSAAPTIRSRCSRSACRARSAFPSPPDLRAWNCARAVNAAVNRMQAA